MTTKQRGEIDVSKMVEALGAREPNVVPFGKYRGQPVEVLRRDQSYMDWLAGQEGIRRQYPWIFSVTINNGAEPSETPEHNQYQALFLDPEFARDVYEYIHPGHQERMFRLDLSNSREEFIGPLNKYRQLVVSFEANMELRDGYRTRQIGAADVQIGIYQSDSFGLRIEIKPAMGDDYPAVLRQMKAAFCNVLYLVAYTGSGATLDQVRQMFAASEIKILMHSDFWE